MDLTFLLVTLILIIFLFISYLLRVIKLSTPLLLIYLIFCFTYIIDNETSKDTVIINDDINDIQNSKGDSEIADNSFVQDNNIEGINFYILRKTAFGWVITCIVVGLTAGILSAQGIYGPSSSRIAICENNTLNFITT